MYDCSSARSKTSEGWATPEKTLQSVLQLHERFEEISKHLVSDGAEIKRFFAGKEHPEKQILFDLQEMKFEMKQMKQQVECSQKLLAQSGAKQQHVEQASSLMPDKEMLAHVDRMLSDRLAQELASFRAILSKELIEKLPTTLNLDKLEVAQKLVVEKLDSLSQKQLLSAPVPSKHNEDLTSLKMAATHVPTQAKSEEFKLGLIHHQRPAPPLFADVENPPPPIGGSPELKSHKPPDVIHRVQSNGSLGSHTWPVGADDSPERRPSRSRTSQRSSGKRVSAFARKLGIHDHDDGDLDVDSSKMVLKDNSSIANVFAYDVDLESPPYHVEELYWESGTFRDIAVSHQFQNLTMLVVVLNAIWLSIETHNESDSLYGSAWYYIVATNFFGIYFTLELFIRFMAFQYKHDCIRDGWFRFDLFLVITMILDIWVIQVITHMSAKGDGSEGGLRIPTQPLRMLRLFKLSRMARLMKTFPELVTMIKGMMQATRAVVSSLALIGIMVYSWAILIHSLVGGDDEFNNSLKDRVGYSLGDMNNVMWTLIMTGTFMLDNTAPLLTIFLFSNDFVHVMTGVCFLAFQYFSCLLVLQMLIGVLTDVVKQVQRARRDAETVAYIKQELMGEMAKFQTPSGKISKQNLMPILSSDNAKVLFKKLQINRLFLMNMAALLFPNDNCEVSTKAVLELMIMCRSSNMANVQILSHALAFLSGEIGDLHAYTVHHLHAITGYLPGDEIYGRLPGETHSAISEAMSEELVNRVPVDPNVPHR